MTSAKLATVILGAAIGALVAFASFMNPGPKHVFDLSGCGERSRMVTMTRCEAAPWAWRAWR